MRIIDLLKPGLRKGKLKPEVILLNSPWEKKTDPAVKFESSSSVLQGMGYRVLNKRRMTFTPDEILSYKSISWHTQQTVTVWVETHGIPGFVLGNSLDLNEECLAMYAFSQYIQRAQKELGITVSSIILGACNSATEYLSEDHRRCFFSAARLLSIFLPDIEVLGFVGRNTNAKLTNLYVQEERNYKPVFLPLVSGSILYKAGFIVENYSDTRTVFCPTNELTSQFINACDLNEEEYFKVGFQEQVLRNTNNLGGMQKKCVYDLLLGQESLVEQPIRQRKSPRYDSQRFFSSASAIEDATTPIQFDNQCKVSVKAITPERPVKQLKGLISSAPRLFARLAATEEALIPINLYHEFESISVLEDAKEPLSDLEDAKEPFPDLEGAKELFSDSAIEVKKQFPALADSLIDSDELMSYSESTCTLG